MTNRLDLKFEGYETSIKHKNIPGFDAGGAGSAFTSTGAGFGAGGAGTGAAGSGLGAGAGAGSAFFSSTGAGFGAGAFFSTLGAINGRVQNRNIS